MADCPCCGQALPELSDLIVDPSGILVRNGRFARLTQQEFTMFEDLRSKPARLVTKETLLTALYSLRSDADEPEIKIIDVFVCKLRKKIAPLGIEIQTVWGQGYRYVPVAVARKEAA